MAASSISPSLRARYIVESVRMLLERDAVSMKVRAEVHDAFKSRSTRAPRWPGAASVNTWYKNAWSGHAELAVPAPGVLAAHPSSRSRGLRIAMTNATAPHLLISTRKGLFTLATDDRRTWEVSEPAFLGHIISHAVLDPRDGRRCPGGGQHWPLRAHRLPVLGFRCRRGPGIATPPAFTAGEPLARSLRTVFWLAPGHASGLDRCSRKSYLCRQALPRPSRPGKHASIVAGGGAIPLKTVHPRWRSPAVVIGIVDSLGPSIGTLHKKTMG